MKTASLVITLAVLIMSIGPSYISSQRTKDMEADVPPYKG